MKLNQPRSAETVSIQWERTAPRSILETLALNKSLPKLFPSPDYTPPVAPQEDVIKKRLEETYTLGEQPLWDGYDQPDSTRTPELVSTTMPPGRFYASMVRKLHPKTVVEFGTAFGVSGMYWLSGLEANQKGHLYTFEVNDQWADIAEKNLKALGDRFTLTRGLFEEHIDQTIGDSLIDIAFIDGVHTSEWVIPQYELVVKRLSKNGVIILDDIAFSNDMEECWKKLSNEPRVKNAARFNNRVGIIQLF